MRHDSTEQYTSGMNQLIIWQMYIVACQSPTAYNVFIRHGVHVAVMANRKPLPFLLALRSSLLPSFGDPMIRR